MAAKISSSQLFLSNNFNDDVTEDSIDDATCNDDDWLSKTRVKMIDNVKVALKASKDALAMERQRRIDEKKMYETKIEDKLGLSWAKLRSC